MSVRANREEYLAVFVNPEVLEKLWRKDHLHIAKWKGGPSSSWFWRGGSRSEKNLLNMSFITPDISIESHGEGDYLHFVNGRHRTRWLLQSGVNPLPIGLTKEQVVKAQEIGLYAAPITDEQLLCSLINQLKGII